MRMLRASMALGTISAMALVSALPERKLTKEFLESEIDKVEYNRFGETNTHCTITTKSGFSFTGESACVDPNNFDQKIGEKFAYENAFNKMWTPYGFWLHKALAEYDYKLRPPLDSEKLEACDHPEIRLKDMAFGSAITAMKDGHRVARSGWNGKGMWLIYIGGNEYDVDAPLRFNTTELAPYIAMKTADNKLVPWLASQTDVLAEDWQIVE